MRRFLLIFAVGLVLMSVSAFAAELSGILTCEKCRHTDEKAMDCAKTCVKNGVPVGFMSADGTYYKVTNQDKVKAHIGHKVTLSGNVQGDSITVDSVKMTPAKKTT